jgi:hypothetical protein
MMKYLRQPLLHVLLPLLASTFIYILFRSNTWFHLQVLHYSQNKPLITLEGFTGKIIVNQIPDFCWSYSLASSLFLWHYWSETKFYRFPVFVLLVLLASEFVQLLLSGYFTFDWADVIAAVIAFLLSFWIVYENEKG